MKNYYEILEVDRHASQEVIDRSYRVLVKKYHPDLQQGVNQQESAEKMKIINEAYDTLSNEQKRVQYDEKLEYEEMNNQAVLREQQERIMQENYELKQQLQRQYSNNYQPQGNTIDNMSRVLNEQINQARRQAYNDAYIQDMRNRGYKIRYKKSLKDYFKAFIALVLTIFVLFLIYQIPFVKNFFAELYQENDIFKAIVNIIKNTLSSTL